MRLSSNYIAMPLFIACIALVIPACTSSKNAARANVQSSKGNGKSVFDNEAEKMKFDNLFFDATKAKLLGRYEDAAEKFEECLQITNKVADVYYQLSICYAELGRPQRLEMLEKAVALDPDNRWYLEEQADALVRNRKNEKAAETYKKLVEIQPDNQDYYYLAVEQLMMANKAADAIDLLDKMEKRFGITEEIISKKEDIYLYLGKPEKAIAEVKKLVEATPNHVPYMGMLAELYSATGQYDKAFDYFNKILVIEPHNGKAHFGLAALYRQKNDSANTIKELKLAFEDKEVLLKDKINVILSMAPLGDNNVAYRMQVLELAEIIVHVHPAEPHAHAVYADLLFGDKQYARAIKEYKETLLLDENNYKVWQQLLSAYEEQGDYANLGEESDQALELFPNRVIFYYYNATAAYHTKNYKKAAATAQAGLDLGINDDIINLGLYSIEGDAQYRLKDYAASYMAFESALEIDPANTYVLNNYAYYLSEQGERLEKAASMAKKAIELKPESPAYLDTYGWILYKSGRYNDALDYVKKALSYSPTDGEILEHLGDIYYRLGNKEQAILHWKKSKESGHESAQLDKKIHDGKLPE